MTQLPICAHNVFGVDEVEAEAVEVEEDEEEWKRDSKAAKATMERTTPTIEARTMEER